MAENDVPAAAPAAERQGGDIPAQQGNTHPDTDIESIVRARLKEDREAFERQLGLSDLGLKIKDVKDILKAKKEADEAKKTELEKLTGERDTHKSDAQAAKLELAKVKALVKAGVDLEKIDALLKRVVGSTPEEIEADITELKDLGLLNTTPARQPQATGAGQTGIQNQSGNTGKIWTQSEIRELRLSGKLTDDLMTDIRKATSEGRVQ